MATGSVRRKHDGWEIRVSAGYDPDTGKRRRISRFVHGTLDEAEQALLRLRLELLDGASVDAEQATVADLLDSWLTWATPRLSPTTARRYDQIVRVHLVPRLGSVVLRRLTPATIDRTLGDLERTGLAPLTVRHIHAVLRRALNQAVRWGMLTRNPAVLASPPPARAGEIRPPSPADVVRLIKAVRAEDEDAADFFHVAATTGMRRGELCGLQWDDIDYDAGTLTVRRSVAETGTGNVVKAPKTHQVRRLALDTGTLDLLWARRGRCSERARAAGVELGPWIWGADVDHAVAWPPDRATGAWQRATVRHGLPGVRLHDLRHMHVTETLAAGIPVRTVASRVGHSSATMTLNVYGHALEIADRAAAEVVASAFSGVARSPTVPDSRGA
jgi:integrase